MGYRDLNPGHPESESGVLPTELYPSNVLEGLEPPTVGFKGHRSSLLSYRTGRMERDSNPQGSYARPLSKRVPSPIGWPIQIMACVARVGGAGARSGAPRRRLRDLREGLRAGTPSGGARSSFDVAARVRLRVAPAGRGAPRREHGPPWLGRGRLPRRGRAPPLRQAHPSETTGRERRQVGRPTLEGVLSHTERAGLEPARACASPGFKPGAITPGWLASPKTRKTRNRRDSNPQRPLGSRSASNGVLHPARSVPS